MTLTSRGATGNLRTVVVEGGNVVVRAGDDKGLDSPWITRAEIVGFIHRGTVRSHKGRQRVREQGGPESGVPRATMRYIACYWQEVGWLSLLCSSDVRFSHRYALWMVDIALRSNGERVNLSWHVWINKKGVLWAFLRGRIDTCIIRITQPNPNIFTVLLLRACFYYFRW